MHLLAKYVLYGFAFVLLFSCQEAKNKEILEVKRNSFSFQHYSDWSINNKEEDYDPDALFSLEHEDESSMVMFMIFDDSIDTKDMIESQEEGMREKLIKNPESVKKFSNWGRYQGRGVEINGKALGVFRYIVRIFVWTNDSKAFLILEQVEEKGRNIREAGFSLIRKSFKIN